MKSPFLYFYLFILSVLIFNPWAAHAIKLGPLDGSIQGVSDSPEAQQTAPATETPAHITALEMAEQEVQRLEKLAKEEERRRETYEKERQSRKDAIEKMRARIEKLPRESRDPVVRQFAISFTDKLNQLTISTGRGTPYRELDPEVRDRIYQEAQEILEILPEWHQKNYRAMLYAYASVGLGTGCLYAMCWGHIGKDDLAHALIAAAGTIVLLPSLLAFIYNAGSVKKSHQTDIKNNRIWAPFWDELSKLGDMPQNTALRVAWIAGLLEAAHNPEIKVRLAVELPDPANTATGESCNEDLNQNNNDGNSIPSQAQGRRG